MTDAIPHIRNKSLKELSNLFTNSLWAFENEYYIINPRSVLIKALNETEAEIKRRQQIYTKLLHSLHKPSNHSWLEAKEREA